MTTPYSPAGPYHTAPRVLTDDDDQIAASYNACLQDAHDNAAAAYTGLITEQFNRAAADTATRALVPGYDAGMAEVDLSVAYAPAGWERWGIFGPPAWHQNNSTEDYYLTIPLVNALPKVSGAVKITAFGVTIVPATGHSATLPVMPLVRLIRVNRAANNISTAIELLDVGGPSDTVIATPAQYEAVRNLVGTPATPHVYNGDYLYFLQVQGETGSGYVAGLRVQAARIGVVRV